MDLIFTPGAYGSLEGRNAEGLRLFTISDSTACGGRAVNLRIAIEPVCRFIRVEPVEGDGQRDNSATRRAAMDRAGQILSRWAEKHLGVDLDVNIIDNTQSIDK